MTTSTGSTVAGAGAARSEIEIGSARTPQIVVVATAASSRDEVIAAFATINEEYQRFSSSRTLAHSSLENCQKALSKIQDCADAVFRRDEVKEMEKKVVEMTEFEAALLAKQKEEQRAGASNSLVLPSMQIINDAYRVFQQAQSGAPSATTTTAVQVFNPTAFDRCVSALEKIEASYRQAAKEGLPTEQLKSDFEQAQRQVQEMNMASGVLTRQDLRGIQSFTQPPIETYYIDSTGEKYIQPDHSQLLTFGGKFFLQGEYEGIGLSRQQVFGGKVCDILYLTKKPDQIEYEIRNAKPCEEQTFSWVRPSSWVPFNFGPESTSKREYPQDKQMRQRLETQNGLLKTVKAELGVKVQQQWKYSSYGIFTYEELRTQGLSEEHARKSHAIAFYYKKS